MKKRTKNTNANRERIPFGEFKKRLKAGDPEMVRMMNEYVEKLRRESQPLIEWWEKLEDNPDTKKQMRYFESLSESGDPAWRRIGENIDIESFVEIMNQVRDESGRIELPALIEITPKKPYEYSLPHKRERDKIIWDMSEDGATLNHICSELAEAGKRVALNTVKNNIARMKKIEEKKN